VYLWNYCNDEWDLIWEHTYRENKRDCAVVGCYWWGPGFELAGDPFPRPQINELGYEDSLLFHDGVWSELRDNETAFRDPEDRPDLSPWQLFHLDPNRGFGVGNFLNENDQPTISGQSALTTAEDTALELRSEDLIIEDPDIDPIFHFTFGLRVLDGENYSVADATVVPESDFNGALVVPVIVNDGELDSPAFDLLVDVTPVNDPPILTMPIDDQVFQAGASVLLNVATAFLDPDEDALSFTASGLPASLTLNAQGVIAGTLVEEDVLDSPFLVSITATDPTGLDVSDEFTVNVVIVDSDGDQIPDDWEIEFGLDPLDPQDAELDADEDSLTNLQEYGAGTDPRQSDTDRDGLTDDYELRESLDPLDGVCPSWICIDGLRGWRAAILRGRD
jgi:hypothetical protein